MTGSVSQETVKRFLEEAVQILRSEETFFRKIKIHILECDAGVQKDRVIRSRKDVEALLGETKVSGFGGTDFRPVFSYLEALIEAGEFSRLRGLLYFTDGLGTFPEKPPSFPSAFILPAVQAVEPKIPPWADGHEH